MAEGNLQKGYSMEEDLRRYFLSSGYFVIRGVTLKFSGEDITDIDLFLYSRISPMSRSIGIVDIKNKKSPQAMERILWTKGLKSLVGADVAIVATTDKRSLVTQFGEKMNVTVLDGNFLAKINKSEHPSQKRISEEEFTMLLTTGDMPKLDGDWKGKIDVVRTRIVGGLNFDTANFLMSSAAFFAQEVILRDVKLEAAKRCFFLVLSYLLLCIDFIFKDVAFLEPEQRKKIFADGFMFGNDGRKRFEDLLNISTQMVTQYVRDGSGAAAAMKQAFKDEMESHNVDILVEFFSDNETGRHTFSHARLLESAAMARDVPLLESLPIEIKGIIGCLCDYWNLSRTEVFSKLN